MAQVVLYRNLSIVTTNEEMLALKHDIIIRYKMDYFD